MAYRGRLEEVPLAKTKPTDKLTVDEVAKLCNLTHGRVCQLLRSGEMKGEKFAGVVWQIERREADKFAKPPEGKGRPREGTPRHHTNGAPK